MPEQAQKPKSLAEWREARGWSREKLAGEVGTTLTTIVNLEKGQHEPRIGLALDLAHLLGARVEDIDWPLRPRKKPARSSGQ